MRRTYYLIRRGGFWYYRLNRESGLVQSDEVTWHTTGCESRKDAESFLEDLLADGRHPATLTKHQSFLRAMSLSDKNSITATVPEHPECFALCPFRAPDGPPRIITLPFTL